MEVVGAPRHSLVTGRPAPDRAGSGDGSRPESGDGHRGALRRIRRLAVGASVHRGDTFTVLRNGDEVFPAMLDAIRQARSRISFESFIYEDGEVGDQFTQALADAARRGVTVRIVLDAMARALGGIAEEAHRRRRHDGVVQPGAAVDDRGIQLPHTPQGAGRRRRDRHSPAASGSPTTGLATPTPRSTGATRSSGSWGRRCARSRRRFTRTGSSPAGSPCPRSIPSRLRSTRARARSSSGAIRPAASATSSCCICCRSPARGGPSTSSRRTSSSTNRRGGRSTRRGGAACACAFSPTARSPMPSR